MLHILLLILKIIGIILAVLLGILLFAVICVLFVPIRYLVKADGKLGEEEPVRIKISIHWLLHIVNAIVSYPSMPYVKIRLLCFTLFDSSKKKEKSENEPKNKEADKNNKRQKANTKDVKNIEEIGKEEFNIKEADKEAVKDVTTIDVERLVQNGEKESKQESVQELEQEPEEKGFIKNFILALKSFLCRLWESVKNIEYTIKTIYDKIRTIIENIRYYTDVIKSDVFQNAWAVCKKQILKILRMLKPTKCKVNLLVGTGDPAGTGQLLSVYGMFYPFIGNHVFIQSDFENQVVEGDLYIKGRIRVFVLLMAALKLYMNKDIKHLLRLLKREEM